MRVAGTCAASPALGHFPDQEVDALMALERVWLKERKCTYFSPSSECDIWAGRMHLSRLASDVSTPAETAPWAIALHPSPKGAGKGRLELCETWQICTKPQRNYIQERNEASRSALQIPNNLWINFG